MGLFDFSPAARTRPRNVQFARPMFARPDGWRPCDDLPELHGVVALDAETLDPGLAAGMGSAWPHQGLGYACGWGIAWSGGDAYYSLRHAEGTIDEGRFYRWLKTQAEKPDVTFVYANAPYDVGWLSRYGISPVNLPHDVQAMGALLDEFAYS